MVNSAYNKRIFNVYSDKVLFLREPKNEVHAFCCYSYFGLPFNLFFVQIAS